MSEWTFAWSTRGRHSELRPDPRFGLTQADGRTMYRVAKDQYVNSGGILSVLPNNTVGPTNGADSRGRFDSLGRTVYLADSADCAFAEVLMPFRRRRDALAVDAQAIVPEPGEPRMTLDEYIEAVTKEAAENDLDAPWAVGAEWQMARSIFSVRMPLVGWWVRIDDARTLDFLSESNRDEMPRLIGDTRSLTLADVTGENRALTTFLAQRIRTIYLEDGSYPLGIEYPSKSGTGRCFAYFARRLDDGLLPGPDDPAVIASHNVAGRALTERAHAWGIPILPGRYLGHI